MIINEEFYDEDDILSLINENIGTIQINFEDDSLKKFVTNVVKDINKCNYILLSYSPYIEIFKNLEEYRNNPKNTYILHYDNTGVNWIKNIDFIIINSPKFIYKKTSEYIKYKFYGYDAKAYVGSPDYTQYGKNELIQATVVLINPHNNPLKSNAIYHELHHYFRDYNIYINTGRCQSQQNAPLYKELIIVNADRTYNIDLFDDSCKTYRDSIVYQTKINKHIVEFINDMLIDIGYFLSFEEIPTHNENIFGEFEYYCLRHKNMHIERTNNMFMSISRTYKAYCNIEKILDIFENNMAYNVPETFMSIHGETYYKVYDIKKNVLKFTRIIDKLKYKLQYHKKNVHKIIGYCLEIYGN